MTTIKIPHTMDNVIIEAGARVTDNKYRIATRELAEHHAYELAPCVVAFAVLVRFFFNLQSVLQKNILFYAIQSNYCTKN